MHLPNNFSILGIRIPTEKWDTNIDKKCQSIRLVAALGSPDTTEYNENVSTRDTGRK